MTNEPDIGKLMEELEGWKAERAHFPGWLILPSKNLLTLTNRLKRSAHSDLVGHLLYYQQIELPLAKLIEAWFELNWRLERALCALESDWVKRLEALLERTDPLDANNEVSVPHLHWNTLAVACLRHHREFLNHEEFKRWCLRIEARTKQFPELNQSLNLQKCLHAMAVADEAACRNTLANWDPEASDEPFWMARKACVLAEIGMPEQADALLEKCQVRLHRDSNHEQPFFFTSRMAWIVEIRSSLGWVLNRKEDEQIADDYWEMLAIRDKTNPTRDLQHLWGTRPDVRRKLRKEADTDRRGGITYKSPQLWYPMNHIQLLRVREEAGFPYRIIGKLGMRMLSDLIRDCFADLTVASDWLAAVNLMAAREKETLEEWLPDDVIPSVPEGMVLQAEQIIANLFESVEREKRPSEEREDYVEDAIRTLTFLLPRFHQRFTTSNRVKYVARFLRMARLPMCRRPIMAGGYGNAIEAMMRNMLEVERHQLVKEVVEFPVPEEIDAHEPSWPEPAIYITGKAERPDDIRPERIKHLISLASKSGAALRLLEIVHRLGVLTADEQHAFASLVWQMPEPVKWMEEHRLRAAEILSIPELEPGQRANAYRSATLAGGLKRFTSGNSMTYGSDDNRWLISLLVGTSGATPGASPDAIDWSAEEAFRLFGEIQKWWAEEGPQLATKSQWSLGAAAGRMHWVMTVLARVILPRLAEPEASQVRYFIGEVKAHGLSGISAMPGLLQRKPDLLNRVADDICTSISLNPDDEPRNEGLWALQHWSEGVKRKALPIIPDRVIEKLAELIIWEGTKEGGSFALHELMVYVQTTPAPLSEKVQYLVSVILDGYRYKAVYPIYWYEPLRLEEDVVQLRVQCVALAQAVSKLGMAGFDAVQYWLASGKTDPLPRVRNVLIETD
ncbi:hypothetical protein [Ferrovibrio sp.]|uniref:hypothetical protein n=1 Tax=Ferrovibrio sp. TaxID=1917215 RepID=UPI000CB8BFC3|nr:hypothetical protein [Ferrovibrio sp.]PJI41845.1 MAG: hypothetical protein CTR53_05120 [Ferrovibrio sp.]